MRHPVGGGGGAVDAGGVNHLTRAFLVRAKLQRKQEAWPGLHPILTSPCN
jgi:hypothetical protein